MKTKLLITVAVLVVFGMACSKPAPSTTTPAAFVDGSAKASPTRDPNPTKDPKIDEGIKRNERETEERRAQEKEAQKPKDDNFNVSRRNETPGRPPRPKK